VVYQYEEMLKIDKPLSILLVEDEPTECTSIIEYIETTNDVRLVQTTNNAEKALEHTVDYLPDVIILDLELHKGGGNGIVFLTALNEKNLTRIPYILVTTNNISSVTHNQVRWLGVDFIMLKSQDDYSAESVIEFLRTQKKAIQVSRKRKQESGESDKASPIEKKRRLETQVATEMELIGISPKAKGLQYLIYAIMLIIDGQPQGIIDIIAGKYGQNPPAVERAMQNAINRAWKTNDIEELRMYYTARIRSDKGVPTLTEFVHYYANKIKLLR